MTELRKGQRVQLDAVIMDPEPDQDGDVYIEIQRGDEGVIRACVSADALRFDADRPTYLARREAMVRAIMHGAPHLNQHVAVEGADETLRAIDETPVPEWAGGEHE